MNANISQISTPAICERQFETREKVAGTILGHGVRLDFWFFALVIAALNVPMLLGTSPEPLIFFPSAVVAGEWWRVFTHPFVHVSWYHLLLDATAFILLYRSLTERSWLKRVAYVAACGVGCLLTCLFASDALQTRGLCGLSAIAHGLMAICAFEMMNDTTSDDSQRWTGIVCLILVAGKSLFEAWTGGAFFNWLHFGLMGEPVAVSHLGGVLGGITAFSIVQFPVRKKGVTQ